MQNLLTCNSMPMKSTVYYIPIRFLLDLDKLIHIWIRKTEKPNLICTGWNHFQLKKIVNFDYFLDKNPEHFEYNAINSQYLINDVIVLSSIINSTSIIKLLILVKWVTDTFKSDNINI